MKWSVQLRGNRFGKLKLKVQTVPYADPRPPYHRKQAFDFGDGGLGHCTNNLELGCDCLGVIKVRIPGPCSVHKTDHFISSILMEELLTLMDRLWKLLMLSAFTNKTTASTGSIPIGEPGEPSYPGVENLLYSLSSHWQTTSTSSM